MAKVCTGGKLDRWSCIPAEETNNKNAIYFAITDNYSFAVANVIMGLNKHSAKLMQSCDILIYHNDVSEKNQKLLKSLHPNTCFIEMTAPVSWNELLNHKSTMRWGSINICKYFGFMLINRYEKVLFLDADMHVIGDISDLFEIEEEMAWRNVLAWKASDNFAALMRSPDDYISAGNAGLIYFTDKLRRYSLDEEDIANAFEKIKNLKRGGNDERIVAWIAYDNKINVKELDVRIYNTPIQRKTPATKLLHFLDYIGESTKPWKNLSAYLYFEDWAENYQRWLQLGGEGLVNFTKEDYFKLFSFDKLKRTEQLEIKLKASNASAQEWKKNYNKVINSKSYKLTKPFRWLANKYRKLKKKVKACLIN